MTGKKTSLLIIGIVFICLSLAVYSFYLFLQLLVLAVLSYVVREQIKNILSLLRDHGKVRLKRRCILQPKRLVPSVFGLTVAGLLLSILLLLLIHPAPSRREFLWKMKHQIPLPSHSLATQRPTSLEESKYLSTSLLERAKIAADKRVMADFKAEKLKTERNKEIERMVAERLRMEASLDRAIEERKALKSRPGEMVKPESQNRQRQLTNLIALLMRQIEMLQERQNSWEDLSEARGHTAQLDEVSFYGVCHNSFGARISIREGGNITQELILRVCPKGENEPAAVDDAWLRQSAFSVLSARTIEYNDDEGIVRHALILILHRAGKAFPVRQSLICKKLILQLVSPRILYKSTKEVSPSSRDLLKRKSNEREEAEAANQNDNLIPVSEIYPILPEYYSLSLPVHSFLASYPRGELASLPDRDQILIKEVLEGGEIEIYYLAGLRFPLLQKLFRESSTIDVVFQTLVYLLLPVFLLYLGDIHKKIRDLLAKPFQKKPRKAGFD